ncbi:hypothetical protein CYMTET_24613, partial [Cymbomonas tetramitiformis]
EPIGCVRENIRLRRELVDYAGELIACAEAVDYHTGERIDCAGELMGCTGELIARAAYGGGLMDCALGGGRLPRRAAIYLSQRAPPGPQRSERCLRKLWGFRKYTEAPLGLPKIQGGASGARGGMWYKGRAD